MRKVKRLPRRVFLGLGGNVLMYELIRRSCQDLLFLVKKPLTKQAMFANGSPVPPSRLIFMVAGHYDAELFYRQGKEGIECFEDILGKQNLSLGSFKTILDFGCGCGRLLTHLKAFTGPEIYGVDYNPTLVSWSKKAFPLANISRNMPNSKLNYEDGMFDFVYAVSVFTHLPKNLQEFWIDEMYRIVKPKGYLLITLHGNHCISKLNIEQKKMFYSGDLVVVDSAFAGTNVCGSYHPETYVQKWLQNRFDIVGFVSGGMNAYQDVYLLKRSS